jgi:hypothetical protein
MGCIYIYIFTTTGREWACLGVPRDPMLGLREAKGIHQSDCLHKSCHAQVCVCVCVREIEEDGSTARSACHPYIDDEAVSR